MVEAVLFDKDGTLIDFHATWDAAIVAALRASAHDEEHLLQAAVLLDIDLATEQIGDGSPFIAESNDVVFALIRPHVDVSRFGRVAVETSRSSVVAALGVEALLVELESRSIPMVVVTNDWEDLARTQMRTLGWHDYFAYIIGADSGFGAKPEPGMVIGACEQLGVDPAKAVMVGDSGHDIDSGNAAGATTVLITNGDSPGAACERADYVITDMTALTTALQLS